VLDYLMALVAATRVSPLLSLGVSPRGSIALLRAARARALCDGRDYLVPDDVKALAYATLGHRIIVSPSARVKNVTPREIVEQALERVPVPGARARESAADSGRSPKR